MNQKTVELIGYYVSKYSMMPTVKYISTHLNISAQTATKLRDEALSSGIVKKSGVGKYYVAEPAKFKKESIPMLKTNDYIITFLRISMLLVGLGAAGYSVYFTGIFLFETFNNIWGAMFFSFILVVFSVGAFEAIIIFKSNKQYGLIFIFSFVWLLATVFSMGSTVIGQYNARAENFNREIEATKTNTQEKLTFEILLEEEKTLILSIAERKQVYMDLQSLFGTLTKEEKKNWFYWDTYNKMIAEEKKISELSDNLDQIRKDKKEFLAAGKTIEETEQKEVNFYTWIESVLGWKADIVAFVLSIFPAVFIDIIAPLALAVSMFLRRKESE